MGENALINHASKKILPENYRSNAIDVIRTRQKVFRKLLEECKWPDDGWPDDMIEELIQYLSQLDSNNFAKKYGLGEREGRIYSGLVRKRHYSFSHGVGRSGSLNEAQPKAIGSTILANLTNELLLDVFKHLGLVSCQKCLIVPMATGMTLMLSLLSLKKSRPAAAKYVLWSRIDQKSCLKCILSADLTPVIIDVVRDENGQLVTNVQEFRSKIQVIGAEQIVCLFATTSCFAPRASDNIVELAKLCAASDVPLLVNNAYGMQSSFIRHLIEKAGKTRLDLFVQSTDKNFMVPVGGAIVASSNAELVNNFSNLYPGRGSSSQHLDLLITLLAMGRNGNRRLLEERKLNYNYLKEQLRALCDAQSTPTNHLSVMECKDNRISVAVSMPNLSPDAVSLIGSKLFKRHIMGVRAVPNEHTVQIEDITFTSWGNHTNEAMPSYLTVAAAIGVEKEAIDEFIKKLSNVLKDSNSDD